MALNFNSPSSVWENVFIIAGNFPLVVLLFLERSCLSHFDFPNEQTSALQNFWKKNELIFQTKKKKISCRNVLIIVKMCLPQKEDMKNHEERDYLRNLFQK